MKTSRKILTILFLAVLLFVVISCDNSGKQPKEDSEKFSVWDGTAIDTSWYSDDKSEFVLNDASQLAGLAKLVNEGNSFSGKTISLGIGMDLNSKQWTPIGLYADENDSNGFEKKIFSGTFNGDGHSIIGLLINNKMDVSSYRGFIGYTNGVIKNFTIKGEVNASDSAAVVAALDKGGSVDNVTSYVNVTTTRENGQAKLAGIVLTLKDKQKTGEGYSITNCKNYGNIKSGANDSTAIGGILGWTSDETGKLLIESCENYGNITASVQNAGGIVGTCRAITLKNCSNSGNVTSSNAAGGIIGANDTKPVEIIGSENSGTITGGTNKVGGVAGSIHGSLKDCTTTGSIALVGTLGIGDNENSIAYSTSTEILSPTVIEGSISLENVKVSNLGLSYKSKSAHNLTVSLKNSEIKELNVTMKQNENKSRLFLTKEGSSSLASLNFTGSFDRQNVSTHGTLYVFANEVIAKDNIKNKLTFINRDSSSTDKDFGNASIYYVATGTSSSYTDSDNDVIESVMSYDSTSGEWKESTT